MEPLRRRRCRTRNSPKPLLWISSGIGSVGPWDPGCLEAVVGWVALRLFESRPGVVAPLLGFSSGHSLSVVVCRLQRRMDASKC